MQIVPLNCPFCNGNIKLDAESEAAVCEHCGRPFVVRDAIVRNYVNNTTMINSQNVNIYTQKNFSIRGGVLEKYTGEEIDVVIPDSVVRIGEEAFKSLSISNVTIPDSVREIEASAFEDCRSLVKINIPNVVKEIADDTFYNCISLKSIIIPPSVKKIGERAFAFCKSLNGIDIPSGVEEIGQFAFGNCVSLKNVSFNTSLSNLGTGLRYIGANAFKNCTSLRSVSIPFRLEQDPDLPVFFGCSSLTEAKGAFSDSEDFYAGTPYGYTLKQKRWVAQKRCRHCGGQFMGIFKRVCNTCNKPKDY